MPRLPGRRFTAERIGATSQPALHMDVTRKSNTLKARVLVTLTAPVRVRPERAAAFHAKTRNGD